MSAYEVSIRKSLRIIPWYVCLIFIAILIGILTTRDAYMMLQIGCVMLAFIPALLLSLRDHPMLAPYIVACWVFSPELRRYLDWAMGDFQPFSLILILPHIVTCTLLLSIIKNKKKRNLKHELRHHKFYVFFIGAYLYAAVIGVLVNKFSGIYDMMGYITPALFFFYFFYKPFQEKEIDQMIRAVVWYAVIFAAYGWFQYLTLPPWDKFWLDSVSMNSIGKAEPLGFRMFSTLNSQGPAAVFLSTMVVLMIMNKKWRRAVGWIGIVIIITALFITLVRSAWVTLVIGLISYIFFLERGKRLSKIFFIIMMGICIYFIMSKLPGAEHITSRMQTFQNIEEDHSFQERIQLIMTATPQILSNPIGGGFGSIGRSTILGNREVFAGLGSIDNGYLGVFSTFGLFGGAAFFIGLITLYRHVKKIGGNHYRAMALSTIIQLLVAYLFGGGLVGYQGVLFWLFVSIALAKVIPSQNQQKSLDVTMELRS